MSTQDAPPILSIPEGTQWIRRYGRHIGELVTVQHVTNVNVEFRVDEPGNAAGPMKRGMVTHETRENFLGAYAPYGKRDIELASQPGSNPLPIATVPEPEPVETNGTANTNKRRMHAAEIETPEREEIIGLWRHGTSVTELATAYNTVPAAVHGILLRDVPEEWELSKVMGLLNRRGRPVPATDIQRMLSLRADQVRRALNTAEDNGWVRLDRAGRTEMVSLIQVDTTELVEEPQPEPAPAAEQEQPTIMHPTPPQANQNGPQRPTPSTGHTWRVLVRQVVEHTIDADNLMDAYREANRRFNGAEVLGVVDAGAGTWPSVQS